ncbi:MAG TPA: hypothetical protein VGL40_15215 [Bacillota bacterium]|jgi:hypothetical protein
MIRNLAVFVVAPAGGLILAAAGYLCLAADTGFTAPLDNSTENRRGTGPGHASLPSGLTLRRQG